MNPTRLGPISPRPRYAQIHDTDYPNNFCNRPVLAVTTQITGGRWLTISDVTKIVFNELVIIY